MAFLYTRSQFLSRINAGIQGRQGILIDANETANAAVRETMNEVAIRSAKRQYSLAPKLFNGEYDYSAPSDLQNDNIIDIPPQVKRADGQWFLVTAEEFDRFKAFQKGMVALDQYNGLSVLKIASNIQDYTVYVSNLESLTADGGTWQTVGDLTNLTVDTDDYLRGNGSLTGDIGAGGTGTAGIQNTSMNVFDITQYMGGNGALFIYVKINDPTNITNYQLNIGSGTSAYYSKVVTASNSGAAFVAGWNLIRFDMTSMTVVGSPDKTKIKYVSIFMNKSNAKINETQYKFDAIVLKKGSIYNIRYYTKYGWNDSSGNWKENSSSDSDVLVADTSEFDLFVLKGRILANIELKEWDVVGNLEKQWEAKIASYQMANPDESILLTDEYYSYADRRNDFRNDNNNGRFN